MTKEHWAAQRRWTHVKKTSLHCRGHSSDCAAIVFHHQAWHTSAHSVLPTCLTAKICFL